MREMGRALLVCVLLTLGGCATDGGEGEEVARRALAEVADLSGEVSDIQDQLDEIVADRNEMSDMEDELTKIQKRLENLRELVRDAGQAASSDAASALARAEAVASDLEVLMERYDFHLRRYHR